VSETSKESRYLKAGAPMSCYLPTCKKPFEGTCFRGDDDRFYCSETCAHEGFDDNVIELVKVIQSR
jgi:hypothetical protein